MAVVDAVVPAPWTMHFAMKGVLFAFCFLQLGNDVFDVLAAGFVCHQHCVGRFHHDQVFNPYQADESTRSMHQGIFAGYGHYVA